MERNWMLLRDIGIAGAVIGGLSALYTGGSGGETPKGVNPPAMSENVANGVLAGSLTLAIAGTALAVVAELSLDRRDNND